MNICSPLSCRFVYNQFLMESLNRKALVSWEHVVNGYVSCLRWFVGREWANLISLHFTFAPVGAWHVRSGK